MLWEHAEGVCYLVGAVMLAFLGVIDIKHKKIPMALPVLLGCAAVCIRGTSGLLTAAAGMVPGMMMLLGSRISRGQMGTGDGLLLICIGAMLGGVQSLEVFILSLFFVFIFSCAGLLFKKLSGKSELPFVPFYFAAYIGVVYL